MVITPHLLVGAAIGKRLPLKAAIPAAFASHFLLDRLPHNDYLPSEKNKVALDMIVAHLLFLSSSRDPKALAAGYAAILPDVLIYASRHDPRSPAALQSLDRWHYRNHTTLELPKWYGIGLQVLVSLLAARALAE